ncbi:hypothetical protein THASP1DRAFT_27539 [Thamnocephalis sphaerospora]|uniref:Uncharacterized protein n=1 Tax=Thamnocephalis sphaerospora TaxID=78915 RepID=A0A4P9XWE8_9FUNG|nr:hypothetical protein THASP1DRAFT_27539 [Thamnocephalis sphaerospora]|eukprot:RKP10655.1 hypothetical protein THASP1DRAFT_27539 [Thamnocephalis sphaerospora]
MDHTTSAGLSPPPSNSLLELLHSPRNNSPTSRQPGESNAAASLLSVLNQSSPSPALVQQQQPQQQPQLVQPQQSEPSLMALIGGIDAGVGGHLGMDQERVNEASTAELKSVLFGSLNLGSVSSLGDTLHALAPQTVGSSEAGLLSNVHAIPTSPMQPQVTLEASTPLSGEQSVQSLGGPVSSVPLEHQAPEGRAMAAPLFTYANPFDQLTKVKRGLTSSAPALTATSTPEGGGMRSEPSVQSGYGSSPAMFSRPAHQHMLAVDDESPVHRHHSPLMVGSANTTPDYAARRIREQHSHKAVKGVPSGVRLLEGESQIDVSASNPSMMSLHDLEVTTITLMPTECEMHAGSTIAATKRLIAYAIKGGRVRVIHQMFGTRASIGGHKNAVLDLAFYNPLRGGEHEQRLVTIGTDHRLCVWQFSEPNPTERNEEIPHHLVLELDGAPANLREARFRRAVWHPSDPDVLACAADRGELLIFNLSIMLAGRDDCRVVEGDRNLGAIQLKGHKKPIVDLCFSANGNEIVTASEDGTVRLWQVSNMDGQCVGMFTPCGGLPVTAAKFVENVVNGQVADELRCILVASDDNRLIKLLNRDGSQCLQQLTFHSDGAEFFNVINYDSATRTLALANSRRESLYCAHVRLDDMPQLVYVVEFPLEYPAVSLAVAPDCTDEASSSFALCCVQTGAVQQFHVPLRSVLPRRWERCPLISDMNEDGLLRRHSAGRAANQLTEMELLRSLAGNTSLTYSERIDGTGSSAATPDMRSPITGTFSDGGADLSHRRMPSDAAHNMSLDAGGKNKLVKTPTSGRTPTAGAVPTGSSKTSGKTAESAVTTRDHPAFRSPQLKPRQDVVDVDPVSLTGSHLRILEDSVVSRIGKLLNKELSKREERLERERQSHQAAEIAHYEALMNNMVHSLHETMAHLIVEAVQVEMSERVLPAMERTVTVAVEKAMTTSIEGAVSQQTRQLLSSEALREPVQLAVTSVVKPAVEETMHACIRNVMLPVWQQSLESIRQVGTNASRSASAHPVQSTVSRIPQTGHEAGFVNVAAPMPKMPGDASRLVSSNHVSPAIPSQQSAPFAMHQRSTSVVGVNDPIIAHMEAAIANGQHEDAVVKVLESKNPQALDALMTPSNLTIFFPPHLPTRLGQPILLAFIHQLGQNLQHNRDVRFAWILAVASRINVRDPAIMDHSRRVLPGLDENVKHAYVAMHAELGANHPALATPLAVLRQLEQFMPLMLQP